MTVPARETLLEKLQVEFHALDSSLIAAFLSEFHTELPTRRQLRGLRQTLTKLATAARENHDEQSISEALSGSHSGGSSLSGSTLEGYSGTPTTDSTSPLASPRSTSSSATSFSSPLGFLRTAFPGVPPVRLESAIADATCKDGWAEDVDIERAVQLILTQEYLRALEEGGLDAVEDDDPTPTQSPEWLTVKAKGKKKKAKTKAKSYTINDVRQQLHISERAHRHAPHREMPPRSFGVDIWTAVSSISAQLSSLLPPHPESFFKSFFHSPESKSPAAALRRALTTITSAEVQDASPLDTTVLLSLQDILRSTPEYNEQGPEEQERILSDARLCLRAVQSRHGDALDLVWLLHSLDSGETAEVRLHNQECQDDHLMELSANTPSPVFEATYAGSFSGHHLGGSPSQPDEWNVVSRRKPPSIANPHAGFIPAHMSRIPTHQIGPERHKGPQNLNQRLKYLEGRLTESHMSAARAWKGANSKNLGKEVALYHVDEARKLQEEVKSAALDVARARVGATKKTDASFTTIDLHYTTISQAVILAKEFLRECGASDVHPMRYITGRGNRSVGGKGVLGPAVCNALIEDGWDVSMFAGGLNIRGRISS